MMGVESPSGGAAEPDATAKATKKKKKKAAAKHYPLPKLPLNEDEYVPGSQMLLVLDFETSGPLKHFHGISMSW